MRTELKGITHMTAFLCLCVVMIHLTSFPVGELVPGSVSHLFVFALNKALGFAVPAFIFLSGLKLYSRYGGEKMDIYRFYKRRFMKIVVPYVICVMIYFAYFALKGWAGLNELPQYIFLGTLAAHFYYIIIAVQAYAIFPFLKIIFEKYEKLVIILSLLFMAYCYLFADFLYADRFIGGYIFYFVMGMAFAKHKVYEKRSTAAFISMLVFIAAAVIHLGLLCAAQINKVTYNCAGIVNVLYIVLAIAAIYGICVKLEKKGANHDLIRKLSDASYTIYLYHGLLIFILQYEVFARVGLSVKAEFIISCAALYGLIFAYVLLRSKIKRKRSGSNLHKAGV